MTIKQRFLTVLSCLLLPTMAWAHQALEPVLNKVSLQLESHNWIQTKSALVTIQINATLNDQNILRMQQQTLSQLKQLADSDGWRIINISRNQDSSGLESVELTAKARLSQANLSGIRQKANKLTKPGKKYRITNIAFTPSDKERREANIALRDDIYKQAQQELVRLNNAYTSQHYFIHDITFRQNPRILRTSNRAVVMAKVSAAEARTTQSMSVDNKATLTANVVLASKVNANKANNHV